MSSLGFHSVSNHSVPVKVVQSPTPDSAPLAPHRRKHSLKTVTATAKGKLPPRRKLVIKIRKPF